MDIEKIIDPANWKLYRDKFATDEMREIWCEENVLQKRLDCEAAVALAQAELGLIPSNAAKEIARKANLNYVTPGACAKHYSQTGHDIISMLRVIEEVCENGSGEWVHFGLTTQDILDSSTGLLLRDTLKIFFHDLLELEDIFIKLADEHKLTVMAGRPHGQYGVPMTFGLKVATWLAELGRGIDRLIECSNRLLVGNFTGAVGTYAPQLGKGRDVERRALELLKLRRAEVCTHPARDRIAEFLANLAFIGNTFSRIGNEVYQLQKPEILELATKFREGEQIDSSTMPQKRNPVGVDHWKGIAKLLRGNALVAMEVAVEHERDPSRLAAEQSALPRSCANLAAVLAEAKTILGTLQVYSKNMRKNLERDRGFIMSEALIYAIAKKTGKKQWAHHLVYEVAQEAISARKDLKTAVLEREDISGILSRIEIDKVLDPGDWIGESEAKVEEVIALRIDRRKELQEELKKLELCPQ